MAAHIYPKRFPHHATREATHGHDQTPPEDRGNAY